MDLVHQARAHYEPGVPYEVPMPRESLFHLLQDAAARYPDRAAMDYVGAALSYAQVLDAALRGAEALRRAGVRRGDAVSIALPNCPQHVVAFYAILRLGAIAVEHNPLAPAAQVRAQLARCGSRAAIVWEKCAGSYPRGGASPLETVFTVDITRDLPASARLLLGLPVSAARQRRRAMRQTPPAGTRSWDRALARAPRVGADVPGADVGDVAVILHTGGTDGSPKSVPLTHRNIGANVNQAIFWVFELHEGAETFFSLLPYFHAFGLCFLLCAAVRLGATQLVLPKFDAGMALEAHVRRPVTFFLGVPPMFERIAKRARKRGVSLRSIRFGVSGGMPLSREIADLWESSTGHYIIEGYGMSETSPMLCGSPLSAERRPGTLGLPMPSTGLRLVDLDDPTVDVADGEPGEIVVRGPQVFSGYLDDPEANERAFTSQGWFRTGDVGRNEDGFVVLADRRRELILSGGFNVYPSQVEAAIRTMPGVRDVAVVGLPDTQGREEVAAALVLDEGANPITLQQVRAWAESTVAHYALPRELAVLAELPHSVIGKVMRRKVRDLLVDPVASAASRTTRSVTEALAPVTKRVADSAAAIGQAMRERTDGRG